MSQLINIFLDPGKVFAELKERPTFLVPTVLVIGATVAAFLLYFFTVDPDWFVQHQITQAQLASADVSAADLEMAKPFMSPMVVGGFVTAFTAIVFPVGYLIMALYYLLAGKIAGAPIGFRQGLALTAWSSMPMLLGAIVMAVGVLTSSNQTPMESLQMLNVDPLFVQLPVDSPWSSLAKAFSLLNFWCWFLAALGWKTWTRGSWGGALFVVMLPGVVIFGLWALIAAL
jgi:hypothetical protein